MVLVKKETIIDVIDSLLNRSAKQKPIQKYQTLNCQDSYVKQNRSLKWVAVIQLIQNYTVLKSQKKSLSLFANLKLYLAYKIM